MFWETRNTGQSWATRAVIRSAHKKMCVRARTSRSGVHTLRRVHGSCHCLDAKLPEKKDNYNWEVTRSVKTKNNWLFTARVLGMVKSSLSGALCRTTKFRTPITIIIFKLVTKPNKVEFAFLRTKVGKNGTRKGGKTTNGQTNGTEDKVEFTLRRPLENTLA